MHIIQTPVYFIIARNDSNGLDPSKYSCKLKKRHNKKYTDQHKLNIFNESLKDIPVDNPFIFEIASFKFIAFVYKKRFALKDKWRDNLVDYWKDTHIAIVY